ncbi:sensor histidine kinase [Streptomyces sp. NPDC005805]|uniref:sensor histidine kinase n=1 Tax=Streptomyces sp. NPDC005805 TaxID=3157068 RepID=UPI00340D1AB9
MHTAFFLLLGASLARYLLRHPWEDRSPWIVGLSAALAALYVLGPAFASRAARATPRQLAWLAGVVAVWMVLVVLAPSFAWCAVPLFYTGLRTLPPRAAIVLVALLTVFVVTAQLELASGGFDPNLLIAPPAVAAVATAVFVHSERLAARQRALIDDLIRTRRELAATERREGTLAERQRLAMEIHDTLAQGLSSQQMLLQAADRVWDGDPPTARRHVRTAESIAEHSLAEARRFVHDLAPADLAGSGGLDEALRTVAARDGAAFRVDGTPVPLPDRVRSALVRIAQGALANVREHAAAATVAVTLTYLGDQVVLDVTDDGRGFDPAGPAVDPAETPGPGPGDAGPGAQGEAGDADPDDRSGSEGRAPSDRGVRGHGLPAIRARAAQLGGTVTVESAPGEGTVLSAAIPLEPPWETP